jgi:sugar phosphate permease
LFESVFFNEKSFQKIESFLVWGVSDLYFILAVTVTIFFGVFSSDLQKQLNLTSSELGFLVFGFFLSFGVIQLLMGGLIDSWGPRSTLVLSALTPLVITLAIGLFCIFFLQNIKKR